MEFFIPNGRKIKKIVRIKKGIYKINFSLVLLSLLVLGCSQNSGTQVAPINGETEVKTSANDNSREGERPDKNAEDKTKLPLVSGFVNDFTGVLDDEFKDELEKKLGDFQAGNKIDFLILLIETTGEKSIDEFSLETARKWKIGSENGGLLFTLAIKDRKWRIQIDRKLEEILTNEEVGDFGKVFLEDFGKKKYQMGFEKAVEEITSTLTKKLKNK